MKEELKVGNKVEVGEKVETEAKVKGKPGQTSSYLQRKVLLPHVHGGLTVVGVQIQQVVPWHKQQ